MLLIYRPEGAEERQWPFHPDKLMSSEAEALEKVTGLTYSEFGMELVKGSARSRRALLWVMMKRENPTLRLNQIDPPVGSIGLDFETHELALMRKEVESDTDMSDDDRATILEELDKQIGDGDVDGPKAPASDDVSSASATSPTTSTSRPKLASA